MSFVCSVNPYFTGGDIIFKHGTSNSTGVAIPIKKCNSNIKILKKIVVQGRASILEIECDSVNYCLVNIYAPNNYDVDFLIKLVFLKTLGRTCDDYVIMAGDWNTVLNNSLIKIGGAVANASHKTQNLVNSMMCDYGLSDSFRLKRGNDIYSF